MSGGDLQEHLNKAGKFSEDQTSTLTSLTFRVFHSVYFDGSRVHPLEGYCTPRYQAIQPDD